MALVDLISSGVRGFFNSSLNNPNTSIEQWAAEIGEASGRQADAGVRVTTESAIGLPAVWRGINVVCNDVSKLHCAVQRVVGPDDYVDEPSHGAYRLVNRLPCPSLDITSGLFRKWIQNRAMLTGNGYALVLRDRFANPIELLPLSGFVTPIVEVTFQRRRLWYVVSLAGENRRIPAEDMLHIRGLSWDGLIGYDVITVMCQALGLAIAGQTFASKYFAAGGKAGGYLVAPGNLTEPQIKQIRETWHQMKPGIDAAHRPGVLYGGMDWKQVTIDPDKAQALETRKMSRRDVANILNVEPYKLGEETGDSYGSLEIRSQDHLDSSIDPWLITHEEEYSHKLLTEEEKDSGSHVIRFDRSGLMRVDFQVRAEAHRKYREMGVLSVDDVRGELDWPMLGDADGGDLRHVPRNWTILGHELDEPAAPQQSQLADPAAKKKADQQAEAFHELFVHQCQRLQRAEAAKIVQAAKDPKTMLDKADATLAEFESKWSEALGPILRLRDYDSAGANAQRLAADHKNAVREQILQAAECSPADLLASVERWRERVEADEPARLAAAV
jgi:HK97 family phage portal protein